MQTEGPTSLHERLHREETELAQSLSITENDENLERHVQNKAPSGAMTENAHRRYSGSRSDGRKLT